MADVMMGGPETAQQSAIMLISSAPRAGVADPFAEVGTLAWKAWFAAKILNENWIWEVRSLARETQFIS